MTVVLTQSPGATRAVTDLPDLATWTDNVGGVWVNHGVMPVTFVGVAGSVALSDTLAGLVGYVDTYSDTYGDTVSGIVTLVDSLGGLQHATILDLTSWTDATGAVWTNHGDMDVTFSGAGIVSLSDTAAGVSLTTV